MSTVSWGVCICWGVEVCGEVCKDDHGSECVWWVVHWCVTWPHLSGRAWELWVEGDAWMLLCFWDPRARQWVFVGLWFWDP